MEYFNGGYSDIYGNISVFSNLTNLEIIMIHGTQVSGNLSSFKNHPSIKNIGLAEINTISGDILILSTCYKTLQYFANSDNPNISGDISNLRNCTGLQTLYVNITNLEYLTLVYNNSDHNRNITGNISAFANCTNLKQVQFNSTPNITGDVSVFSNCTKLEFLSLWGTGLSGSFTNYNQLTNLTNLVLGYTNVTGPLNGLANMPNMLRIDLASCPNLTGQVNSLANNTNLRQLLVNNI